MKKTISVILLLVMLLPMTASAEFSDITEIPVATDSADILSELGIMIGTEVGMELERSVTRAEAVVLLMRMHPEVTGESDAMPLVFSDMDGHWACSEVTAAEKIGLVDGIGDGLFAPDRNVTGREFAKMTLSMLGYPDITIENSYDRATEAELLSSNYSKKVVYENSILTRSDCARICHAALLTKVNGGNMLKDRLCETGKFKAEDFRVLYSGGESETSTFADKMNSQMPSDKNYMFSPLSIKMALAMAANGAGGETQREILNAIGVADLTQYNSTVKGMLDTYSQSELLRLDIANSIWLNSDRTTQKFSDSYKAQTADIFDAESDVVNNASAAEKINGWVNEKTNGKIPTIVDKDNSDFWAMLVNAVYFKGKWQNQFSKSATKDDTFTDRNGTKTDIKFMNRTGWMAADIQNGVTVVKLPYLTRGGAIGINADEIKAKRLENIDISMYLMMSDEDLNPESELNRAQLGRKYVALSVPRFNIEYSADIKSMLKHIGIDKAFDEKTAEFENMFDSGTMWIDSAIHKTFIKVDEEGTEAAAVTGLGMAGTTALPPEPIVIKFDKPFTFVIKDDTNNEILFMGEYAYCK